MKGGALAAGALLCAGCVTPQRLDQVRQRALLRAAFECSCPPGKRVVEALTAVEVGTP